MTLPFFCGEETLPIGFLTQSLVSTQAGSTEKQIMKPLMLMLFTLCLTGCVQYKWVKPDASEQQETIAETACRAQALRDLPPDNVVSGKYTSKTVNIKPLTPITPPATPMKASERYWLKIVCLKEAGNRSRYSNSPIPLTEARSIPGQL